MHLLLFSLLLYGQNVYGFNFDLNNVIEVKLKSSDVVDRSYFGYSLLLQKGTNPMVIVGAPKQSNDTGGAVFSCDCLGKQSCSEYDIKLENNGSFNGNFLGSSLDGEEHVGHSFVVCAPRLTLSFDSEDPDDHNIKNETFFQRGQCLLYRNSSFVTSTSYTNINIYFLKESFVQSTQTGFDISYIAETNTLIVGAPGAQNYTGGVGVTQLGNFSNYLLPPYKEYGINTNYNEFDYLGYKTGHAKYKKQNYVVAGVPRGAELIGKVLFFDNTDIYKTFFGEKIGSYFGAVFLAVDVNNDKSDEIFIGAPMTAIDTFEEGCVYYYKSITVPNFSFKLEGSKKQGARFGSNIVSLGDIDLDSYKDIAIAAPFEDDSIGAVYIYMGTSEGISKTYAQRLSPLTFNGGNRRVKGFGMGMSKGVDINGNGFNDLAVGAYQSGQVFILPTKEVINFVATLTSNVKAIKTTENTEITFCIMFTTRYRNSYLRSVNFTTRLSIVDVDSMNYVENITCKQKENICRKINVTPVQYAQTMLPFLQVSLMTQVIGNIIAVGNTILGLQIPFAHGCNEDGICQTNISIEAEPQSVSVLLGQTKSITVNLSATNLGEPGYDCEMHIKVPKQFVLDRTCRLENTVYVCYFAQKLDNNTSKEVEFTFQFVLGDDLSPTYVCIDFELKCLGVNLNKPLATKDQVMVIINVQTSLYIEGTSLVDTIEYFPEAKEEKVHEIIHSYTIGNFGPSPAKPDIYLLIPIVKVDERDVFEFVGIRSDEIGNQIRCSPTNNRPKEVKKYDVPSLIKTPSNITTIVDCFQADFNCTALLCEGEVLDISSKTNKVTVILRTKTNLLAKFFRKQGKSKSIITYISSAFAFNGTFIDAHASTMILSSVSKAVPIWVYIVASIIGCLLLGLLMYVLFKCKFFERSYKNKLNEEKGLINTMEEDIPEEEISPMEIFDDAGTDEQLSAESNK